MVMNSRPLIRLAPCAHHLLPQAGEVNDLHLSRLRESTLCVSKAGEGRAS
jgi:hypothetical protein